MRLTVKAIRFLIPGEIRVFATIEAEDARAWITARPGSRADTESAPSTRFARASRPKAPRGRKPLPASRPVAAAGHPPLRARAG